MERKVEKGLTLLHLIITMGVISIIIVILLSLIEKQDQRAMDNKLDRCQAALTYGLAGGLQPVPLQDSWYYFREMPSSNAVSAIIWFMEKQSTWSNHLTLSVVCRADKDNATLKVVDWQLSRLAKRAELTNGYFALFQGTKEAEPHQPIEKP